MDGDGVESIDNSDPTDAATKKPLSLSSLRPNPDGQGAAPMSFGAIVTAQKAAKHLHSRMRAESFSTARKTAEKLLDSADFKNPSFTDSFIADGNNMKVAPDDGMPVARQRGTRLLAMKATQGSSTSFYLSTGKTGAWRPQRPARWTGVDYIISTRRGQALLLSSTAVLLVAGGAAIWCAVGGDKAGTATAGWWQALWISWGLFFDPGARSTR